MLRGYISWTRDGKIRIIPYNQIPWNKGRKETRVDVLKRQSNGHKGYKWTKETRNKMIGVNKGGNSGSFKKGVHYNLGRRGQTPWCKGTKGLMKPNSGSFKKGNIREKSPAWKGGITKENQLIRYSLEGIFWRKSIFERDNYVCRKCGTHNGLGVAVWLEAHHINNFSEKKELRFMLDNGITFCRGCHREFHKIYNNRNNTKKQLMEFLKQ